MSTKKKISNSLLQNLSHWKQKYCIYLQAKSCSFPRAKFHCKSVENRFLASVQERNCYSKFINFERQFPISTKTWWRKIYLWFAEQVLFAIYWFYACLNFFLAQKNFYIDGALIPLILFYKKSYKILKNHKIEINYNKLCSLSALCPVACV